MGEKNNALRAAVWAYQEESEDRWFYVGGNAGVNAETSLLASCFNLARMITIEGVRGLIAKLKAVS